MPEKCSTSKPTLLSCHQARGETTPPEFDGLRTMAEWEEIEVLCVGWEGYSSIEKQIVVNAAQECEVIVLTEDAEYVEDYITANNNGGARCNDGQHHRLGSPLEHRLDPRLRPQHRLWKRGR